jgi:hypothetical protein
MLEPWLVLKQWVFSWGKTVWSVTDAKSFDPFKQINIFNQPTWYNHILIRTGTDLVLLMKDIYFYHLYITSYDEKLETYELYKTTRDNLKKYPYTDLFPKALNIRKTWKFMSDLKIKFNVFIWKQLCCNLMDEQLDLELLILEKYFKERTVYTDKYWEDLIKNYFNFISLDELHLYFWARNFKTNFKWKNAFLMDFVAFPVKLNTRIEWIAQNVNALDIVFRRQSSLYKKHTAKLLWLIKKTEEFEVKNTENPDYDESEITKSSTSINWYKIFWLPKVQYYRTHIISADNDENVYKPWMYFKHIRRMSDRLNEVNKLKEEKRNKKKGT